MIATSIRAGNPDTVVPGGRDDPSDRGPMTDLVLRVVIIADEVMATYELAGQIGMIRPHPGIKHRDNRRGAAGRNRPGVRKLDRFRPRLIGNMGIVGHVLVVQDDIRLNIGDRRVAHQQGDPIRGECRAVKADQIGAGAGREWA
jgi:hypothetical protein